MPSPLQSMLQSRMREKQQNTPANILLKIKDMDDQYENQLKQDAGIRLQEAERMLANPVTYKNSEQDKYQRIWNEAAPVVGLPERSSESWQDPRDSWVVATYTNDAPKMLSAGVPPDMIYDMFVDTLGEDWMDTWYAQNAEYEDIPIAPGITPVEQPQTQPVQPLEVPSMSSQALAGEQPIVQVPPMDSTALEVQDTKPEGKKADTTLPAVIPLKRRLSTREGFIKRFSEYQSPMDAQDSNNMLKMIIAGNEAALINDPKAHRFMWVAAPMYIPLIGKQFDEAYYRANPREFIKDFADGVRKKEADRVSEITRSKMLDKDTVGDIYEDARKAIVRDGAPMDFVVNDVVTRLRYAFPSEDISPETVREQLSIMAYEQGWGVKEKALMREADFWWKQILNQSKYAKSMNESEGLTKQAREGFFRANWLLANPTATEKDVPAMTPHYKVIPPMTEKERQAADLSERRFAETQSVNDFNQANTSVDNALDAAKFALSQKREERLSQPKPVSEALSKNELTRAVQDGFNYNARNNGYNRIRQFNADIDSENHEYFKNIAKFGEEARWVLNNAGRARISEINRTEDEAAGGKGITPITKIGKYNVVGWLSNSPVHYDGNTNTHKEPGVVDITAREAKAKGKTLEQIASEIRGMRGYIVAIRRKGEKGIKEDHLHIASVELAPKEVRRLTEQGWAKGGVKYRKSNALPKQPTEVDGKPKESRVKAFAEAAEDIGL